MFYKHGMSAPRLVTVSATPVVVIHTVKNQKISHCVLFSYRLVVSGMMVCF